MQSLASANSGQDSVNPAGKVSAALGSRLFGTPQLEAASELWQRVAVVVLKFFICRRPGKYGRIPLDRLFAATLSALPYTHGPGAHSTARLRRSS